jgi:hypothetical protein
MSSDSPIALATLTYSGKSRLPIIPISTVWARDRRSTKKVIAQQLEKVLPVAVKKRPGFLPDIYELASKVALVDGRYMITLPKAHDLKDGDRVRLILERGADLFPVVKLVDDTSFSIPPGTPINTKVFVFGKQHNDVRFIDYDAVSMLNVSATQALAKKVEALEAENDRLKVHQTKLGAQEFEKMDAQNAKITALEAENAKLRGEADRLTTIEGEEKAKMVALEPR